MDPVSGTLIRLSLGLGKKVGAAVLRDKCGHHSLYKQAFDEKEVELSQVSIMKIVEGVRAVVAADMKEMLQDSLIHQAEDRLKQITSYFANIYSNLGGTNMEKDRQISNYEERLLLDVLGPLSGSALSVSARLVCLPAYWLAACVHMAILQERALLMPDATSRIDTLRHFARRYAQYAENAYTQGRKERLSKIREFTPKFKVLGMWLGEEPNFSDHGLGECADTIKLCHWNNTSYRNACALYKEVVDKQLEIAVSKHAILENLKVWSQEYPASVQMTSLPTLQGSSSHQTCKTFRRYSGVHFSLNPQRSSTLSDQTFGFTGCYEKTRVFVPVGHQCRDGVLYFSPFIVPGGQWPTLCWWCKTSREWCSLYDSEGTKCTAESTKADSRWSLCCTPYQLEYRFEPQSKKHLKGLGLPPKVTKIECHITDLP